MHRQFVKYIHVIIFLLLLLTTWNSSYNPFLDQNIKNNKNIMETMKHDDPLYQEIKSKSKQFNQSPQDAYIDRVWKKTPGLNGLKVNVSKSYEQMKEDEQFDANKLVYDQIKPKVTLKDLPASPIYRGNPDKNMVALMINVSWGTEHIPDILKTLKENNVKATFFIEGKWAKEHAEYAKMIAKEGHLIGNHAYNHPNMARMSSQQITEQITKTNEIIEAIIEKKPRYFAPPSGSFSDQVVQVAHRLQMETILWTVDTIDWKKPSVSVMMNRVMSKLHPGATILMHPTPSVSKGLDPLIKGIKEKGYKLGTLDKLLSPER
ncbi:polysaccharide deacetylase family protein [Virgibacillus sp. 179-BFC.A HS]|uniref:Polysaccharide deacetylase family protein n=1 Tax=Tigheibacillus jepli TaxID=3035914 RepID=A0ABU5CJ17_9BACI|nr:polysaccharide deacetylase family protein [Virgibacillus sp. 179-BFC.A HS]MDY0405837.1 polysaccharide deacetylase family protein [Virgibacillus sp. 179-BFC.A HS]